ncbi:MAG TPA: hypothetical protein VLH40_08255 [Atribacteraceae bacterium]|nr:hypothetical protein [Atribacteraceae bacterium]
MLVSKHIQKKNFFTIAILLSTVFLFTTVLALGAETTVISGILEEDLIISENTQILGIVDGKVTVPGPLTLILDGIVVGELILESGATVYLNGIVWGRVTNNGGTLFLEGIIEEKPSGI